MTGYRGIVPTPTCQILIDKPLGDLRISGGLALIGAVVSEFVAGTGGAGLGIAYQILKSSYNLQIPQMFTALIMTTSLDVSIFMRLTVIADSLLRNWHENAIKRIGN